MQETSEIILVVTIGVLSMLIFVASLIIFVIIYYRKLAKKNLEIEKEKRIQTEKRIHSISETREFERQRISTDIHDRVGAGLSTVSLILDRVRMQGENKDNPLIIEAGKHLTYCIDEIRSIVLNLSPAIVERFGFSEAVNDICERINSSTLIKVKFSDKTSGIKFADKNIELAIYRITQELITNSVKHSGTKDIWVNIVNADGIFEISVRDFGKGLDEDYQNRKNCLGLRNVESACNLIDADFVLKNHEEKNGVIAVVKINEKAILANYYN